MCMFAGCRKPRSDRISQELSNAMQNIPIAVVPGNSGHWLQPFRLPSYTASKRPELERKLHGIQDSKDKHPDMLEIQ